MTLTHILVFIGAALLYVTLLPERWRKWALFVGSIVAIYWLQPPIRIRLLDFIFPTATLTLVLVSWVVSREEDQSWTYEDTFAAGLMFSLVLLLAFGRYLVPTYRITPSKPPEVLNVVLWIGVLGVLLVALVRRPKQQNWSILILMLAIIGLFVVLKTEPLAKELAGWLREWRGQPTRLAHAAEIEWLGFSYVAFRLIHTLRDRQIGRLPTMTLREYTTYAIFFPAFTAGPIDRAERFLPDLRSLPGADPSRVVQGGMRIAIGIGKKFVVADSLAYFALSATKASQADSPLAMWILVYTYALQIYFDFSGYSDIAIGIGQLFGLKLPENFNQPYLKRNITLFWQSWHITLSQWVRFYIFSPLTRLLLDLKHAPQPNIVALTGQLSTMVVIGLWHGITWHFVAWGIWHGLGLFVHKLWSDYTRRFYIRLRRRPRASRVIEIAGIILTFHFVVIGWIWFALPDLDTSWNAFLKLFGL
jgi:alginate O-acetyltransferase complex protein AlgI